MSDFSEDSWLLLAAGAHSLLQCIALVEVYKDSDESLEMSEISEVFADYWEQSSLTLHQNLISVSL